MAKCKACLKNNSIIIDDSAPLCGQCLNRAGRGVNVGSRVVCEVDDSCSGSVRRIVDSLAVIDTNAGREAWVPVAELVPCR